MVHGVDIGTTSAKAAAFDADGGSHGAQVRRYGPEAGIEEIVEAALSLVPRRGPVAFSAAMHSLVGLDARGRPVTPLLKWSDTAAVDQAERLAREHPELHARTGTPLHPMSPLVKLCRLREQGVTAHRWSGVKELVLQRLTGEWVMDHSCASGTGLMALGTLDWDPLALELAGIAPGQLPRLVPTTHRIGDVVVGAGDGPLANLGLGAVRPGVAACSIGTSGALRVVVEDPAVSPSTFCYRLTEDRWVVGGAINNGGVVLEWLAALLNRPVDELLGLAARVPAGAGGLEMDPYLLSERAPRWDARLRGSLRNLRLEHGPGHLVRAGLEGVCRQLAAVLGSLRDAGYDVREVRATGGFARSPLWRQILADALAMPVGFTRNPEGSAFGAALLGMHALGLADLDRAAALIEVAEVVEPSG